MLCHVLQLRIVIIINIFFFYILETTVQDSVAAGSLWVWLVDIERACALLIGRCLGRMLVGSPLVQEEKDTGHWLTSHLFGSGLQPAFVDLGTEHS